MKYRSNKFNSTIGTVKQAVLAMARSKLLCADFFFNERDQSGWTKNLRNST